MEEFAQWLSMGNQINGLLLLMIVVISIVLLFVCIVLTKRSGVLEGTGIEKEENYAKQTKTSTKTGNIVS